MQLSPGNWMETQDGNQTPSMLFIQLKPLSILQVFGHPKRSLTGACVKNTEKPRFNEEPVLKWAAEKV